MRQRKKSSIEFQLNFQLFVFSVFLCVSEKKRVFSIGWNKKVEESIYFANLLVIRRLKNFLNWDLGYTARLKDVYVIPNVCWIKHLWSFRQVRAWDRTPHMPKTIGVLRIHKTIVDVKLCSEYTSVIHVIRLCY